MQIKVLYSLVIYRSNNARSCQDRWYLQDKATFLVYQNKVNNERNILQIFRIFVGTYTSRCFTTLCLTTVPFLHCGWSLRQHFVLCICQRTKVCYPCMISNNICGIFQSSNGRATDSLSLHNICGHRVCMICDTIPLKDETPITLKFHHTHTYTKKNP